MLGTWCEKNKTYDANWMKARFGAVPGNTVDPGPIGTGNPGGAIGVIGGPVGIGGKFGWIGGGGVMWKVPGGKPPPPHPPPPPPHPPPPSLFWKSMKMVPRMKAHGIAANYRSHYSLAEISIMIIEQLRKLYTVGE